MPATPNVPDRTYHPLDPSRSVAEATPMSRLAISNATTYQVGYWDEFKATVGLRDKRMSARDNIIQRDTVAGDFLGRNVSGGLGLVRGASMLAAYGIGSALTGGSMVGGMVVGSAIDTAIGAVWNASGFGKIQSHLESKDFAQNIGQLLARGTGNTISGHGFSKDDVREFEGFTKDAAARFDVKIEDIQNDIVNYVNKGLLSNTRNIDEFKKQFGQLKSNVKEIIDTLGATQDEAIELMSELNSKGITGKAVSSGISTAKQLSYKTGISATTFIGAGLSAAEAFQGTGLSAAAGFNLGITNRGAIEAGMMTGKISQADIWQLGGADNAAFAMTQQQAGYLNTGQANILLRGAMTSKGDLDLSKLYDLSKSGFGDQLNTAYNNMSGMGYLTYIGKQDDLKSKLMEQGGDVMNAQMMRSVMDAASLSGFNVEKMDLTQLKGFAMASGLVRDGAMFDTMAGSIMAATPGGTASEREIARRSRSKRAKAFVSESGIIHHAMKDVSYGLSGFVDTISTPFDELSGNVIRGIDNTIEDFNSWYLEKTEGVVNYEVAKEDIKTFGRVLASGRLSDLSKVNLSSGVFRDISLKKDVGEVAMATIRKGLIKLDDVKGESLREAYLKNADLLKEKNLFVDGASTEQMIESLQSLPEYKNSAFFEDVNLFEMGANAVTVVDPKKYNAELEKVNKTISLAKMVGGDPDRRDKILAEISTRGGMSMSFESIKQRIAKGMETSRDDFEKASPEEQLTMLYEFTGLSKDDVLKSDDSSKVMATLLVAAENAGVSVDTKNLENIRLGSNSRKVKEVLESSSESFDNFINKLDDSFGGWFGISSKAEDYLGGKRTQSLVNDLIAAKESGDDLEAEKIKNKLISGAPDKVKKSLSSWLSKDEFYKAAGEYFKPQEGKSVSAYEERAAVMATTEMVASALEGFSEGVMGDYAADAEAGGVSLLEDIRSGGGASAMDVAMGMGGSVKKMAEKLSAGGLTSEEKGKLSTRLLRKGSIRDRMLAYATLDREELANVDTKTTKAIEDAIRKRAVDAGFISEQEAAGMDEKAMRETALLLTGDIETGQRYAGGTDVVSAESQAQIELATQMAISLKTLTAILTEMQNKSK